MLRTLVLTVCLLAGICQTTFSQSNIPDGPKSVSSANRYSVYGTAIPIVVGGAMLLIPQSDDDAFGEGLGGAGIIIGSLGVVSGPGWGHAYAGRWGHLAKGSLFRMIGFAVLIRGIIGPDPSGMGNWGKPEEECEEGGSDGALILIGGGIYLWSAIHDFKTLDKSVEKYNRKHAGVSISVNPTYFVSKKAPGIVVSLKF